MADNRSRWQMVLDALKDDYDVVSNGYNTYQSWLNNTSGQQQMDTYTDLYGKFGEAVRSEMTPERFMTAMPRAIDATVVRPLTQELPQALGERVGADPNIGVPGAAMDMMADNPINTALWATSVIPAIGGIARGARGVNLASQAGMAGRQSAWRQAIASDPDLLAMFRKIVGEDPKLKAGVTKFFDTKNINVNWADPNEASRVINMAKSFAQSQSGAPRGAAAPVRNITKAEINSAFTPKTTAATFQDIPALGPDIKKITEGRMSRLVNIKTGEYVNWQGQPSGGRINPEVLRRQYEAFQGKSTSPGTSPPVMEAAPTSPAEPAPAAGPPTTSPIAPAVVPDAAPEAPITTPSQGEKFRVAAARNKVFKKDGTPRKRQKTPDSAEEAKIMEDLLNDYKKANNINPQVAPADAEQISGGAPKIKNVLYENEDPGTTIKIPEKKAAPSESKMAKGSDFDEDGYWNSMYEQAASMQSNTMRDALDAINSRSDIKYPEHLKKILLGPEDDTSRSIADQTIALLKKKNKDSSNIQAEIDRMYAVYPGDMPADSIAPNRPTSIAPTRSKPTDTEIGFDDPTDILPEGEPAGGIERTLRDMQKANQIRKDMINWRVKGIGSKNEYMNLRGIQNKSTSADINREALIRDMRGSFEDGTLRWEQIPRGLRDSLTPAEKAMLEKAAYESDASLGLEGLELELRASSPHAYPDAEQVPSTIIFKRGVKNPAPTKVISKKERVDNVLVDPMRESYDEIPQRLKQKPSATPTSGGIYNPDKYNKTKKILSTRAELEKGADKKRIEKLRSDLEVLLDLYPGLLKPKKAKPM